MKHQTIALDVYGTLIDTSGVLTLLETIVGAQAKGLSDLWRSKQLEYSFRRGLMDRYVDFSIVTQEALEYSCRAHNIKLTSDESKQLMHQYRILPSYPDTKIGVQQLREAGHRVYAYSNGSNRAVTDLLMQAEVFPLLDGVVSMEDVKTFKPSPKGYRYFCECANTDPHDAWLVSGNNFDVMGARSFGMNAAWIKRNPDGIFDPMGYDPTITISALTDLTTSLDQFLL